jgi:5-methylcytosine-specific restriction enzyme subunit McrC
VKTYATIERQPTEIPISDVLGESGAVEIFPEVREKGYFDLDFRAGKLIVVGGKYIGHIPLNARVLIDVRPKIGIARLAQVLERAHEPLRCLHFYRRKYKTDEFVGVTIFEVLVKALLASGRAIIAEGLLREYQVRESNVSSIRGRIDGLQTVRKNYARGIGTKAICRYFELGTDNPLNRLIKYAIWYSAQHLIKLGSTDTSLRKNLSELYEYFESVPLDHSMRFTNQIREYLETQRIPSTRAYYLEACDTALAIVSNSGLDLVAEGQDVMLSSFLVDMETVFENYVRNVLRNGEAKFGINVLDGNGAARGWLFSDSTAHDAKPDLVLRHGERTLLIGDCKYKPRISEHDRYQVIAHALSFGAKRVCIVMPTGIGESSTQERVGKIGPSGFEIEMFVYRIDLQAADLTAEEDKMNEAVFGLCKVEA